jgi:adenine-specific DNA-methyltransferase
MARARVNQSRQDVRDYRHSHKNIRRKRDGSKKSSRAEPRYTLSPGKKKPIDQYAHKGKTRLNNPPAGLVTPQTDPDVERKKTYAYDPHLDPQLMWAGKAERTSFEVPTVSLHVHERIDPKTIIEAVRSRNGSRRSDQLPLFETREENPPLREAIDFYKHPHGWSNRLIAGDSLLIMNSLLEKEGMAGKVQMIYIDPPYGIRYGSNFQPFVNKRDVKDGKDEDLTQEPEMLKAFRDTWELGIHSYLSYLRDRLLLARELLHESGSCFVQISDENIHLVKQVMDEIFRNNNFVSLVFFAKTTGFESKALPRAGDYLVWYAKDLTRLKYRSLFVPAQRVLGEDGYRWIVGSEGRSRGLTAEELRGEAPFPRDARLYKPDNIISQGAASKPQPFEFNGKTYLPGTGSHWKAKYPEGMSRLAYAGRLHVSENTIQYIRFADDFPWKDLANVWTDTVTGQFTDPKIFVVQTNTKVVARCILMTTDPGDLVLDPTCGSGTTAYVAEQWGRRWITCDTSRVAITLAKQRLMTAVYDYYELAHPEEGVGSGFRYKTVPHITLKSIANNPEIRDGMTREQIAAAIAKYADQETLYDQPYVDKSRARVSGPFTVEAVPAPTVQSLEEIEDKTADERLRVQADASVAREGATLRHSEWCNELSKTGIRGKGGQFIHFSRVESLAGTRWLHADAETKGEKPERVVISFGPEYGPLEQRQVELARGEARTLIPKPSIIVFAAFQFDPEAAKDIDELTKEKTGMTFLTAQMNADLLTEDLKKKRASNQGFWLVGRPDVELRQIKKGEHKDKWEVEVLGFDYYNTRTGTIESGDTSKIAMWLLDTDYDGRSLYARQVFFPMADEDGGWARLARNLRAEIDPELIEAYRGTASLPFEPGPNKRVAVEVIDDRGIESLKIVDIR